MARTQATRGSRLGVHLTRCLRTLRARLLRVAARGAREAGPGQGKARSMSMGDAHEFDDGRLCYLSNQ